jgi:hypothetical protein
LANDNSTVSFAHWGTHSLKIGSKISIWNSSFQDHASPYPPNFKLTQNTTVWLSDAAFSHASSSDIVASDTLSGIRNVYDTLDDLHIGWENYKSNQPPTPSPQKPTKASRKIQNYDGEEKVCIHTHQLTLRFLYNDVYIQKLGQQNPHQTRLESGKL